MEIVILLIFGLLAILHLHHVWRKVVAIKSYHFEPSKNTPTVMVIVCTHNEKLNLEVLIPLLLKQNYEDYEIIIVLDRCTDRSSELIRQFEYPRLSFLPINEKALSIHPKKFGITQAINQANCEWILLTDADCRPTSFWLSEMTKGMNSTTDVVLGLSPYFKSQGLLNALIQYETFQTALHFMGSAALGKPYMALGRNMAYRKSSFLQNQGFSKHSSVTGGDDDLFVQSILTKDNYRFILSSDSWVDSTPKTNWASYIRQKTRHFSVGKYYPVWVRKMESIRWIIHLAFWILSITAIVINPLAGTSILAVVLSIKGISFNIVTKQLGKRFNPIWLPFVDLLYVVILPLLSLRSLLVKHSTWK